VFNSTLVEDLSTNPSCSIVITEIPHIVSNKPVCQAFMGTGPLPLRTEYRRCWFGDEGEVSGLLESDSMLATMLL
jgi:hypothetical protein